MKCNNMYYMEDLKIVSGFNKMCLSKTSFRNIKKGGFYTTKKTFKVNNLNHERLIILKDDGSRIEPKTKTKNLFKRLGRFYPIY